MEIELTWQEAAEAWQKGEPVFTIALGGISPGYEQAIQILLFEIMVRWGDRPLLVDEKETMPSLYLDHVEQVAKDLDETCLGFSGAQVGIAKKTAFQFMHYGYAEMLKKAPKDRVIMVSKAFPHV